MASKRNLKKHINNIGAELSAKAVIVGTLAGVDDETIDNLVVKALDAQMKALSHISISFDRVPRDFESGREYRKARRAYFSRAYRAACDELMKQVGLFAGDLNAIMPAEYREAVREAKA